MRLNSNVWWPSGSEESSCTGMISISPYRSPEILGNEVFQVLSLLRGYHEQSGIQWVLERSLTPHIGKTVHGAVFHPIRPGMPHIANGPGSGPGPSRGSRDLRSGPPTGL